MDKKVEIKKTSRKYKCIALKNRNAQFNDVKYEFKKDQTYILDNAEHVRKLTDPLCGVLSVME